jgi:hypothetical protein
MKVLFDTNVLLDVVLARVPFVENAAYYSGLYWVSDSDYVA